MPAMNLATFQNNATTVTARNAEYAGDPLDDVDGDGTASDPYLGCNRAGSCAPGIGINTGAIDPKIQDWTTLDQGVFGGSGGQPTPVARAPQDSQHIGGDGLGDGDVSNNPLNAVVDPYGVSAIDFDDTLTMLAALAQAAPGVGMGALNADPINRTDVTVEIGDRVWGTNDVP